ncbi:hypothetical protein B0H10DRAFT_1833452 [Mycena sp. CBHHK59/15]|nr:hypothetical protein B0H10DRAFT_1833452 [Mycena sp. CBHHK59/15]
MFGRQVRKSGASHVWYVQGASITSIVVHDRYTVWPFPNSQTSICPSSIPFAASLPEKFQNGDKMYPLPPSYSIAHTSVPGTSVKLCYSVTLIVTRMRMRKFRLSVSNTIQVPFNYCPRTRPHHPIQPCVDGFLCDVKSMPEEWRQIVTEILPHPKSALAPIYAHVSIRISDTIPFHVQIYGHVSSLREFLPNSDTDKMYIGGNIIRQIVFDIRDRVFHRNVIIGDAEFVSTPPGPWSNPTDSEASLDWKGEVHCKPDVSVGSFDSGTIRIQVHTLMHCTDFIVIDMRPPGSSRSQFPATRHAHPVKLVTDSWSHYYVS